MIMEKFNLKKPLTFKEIEELATKICWLEEYKKELKRLKSQKDILFMEIIDKQKTINEVEETIFRILE